MQIKVILPNTKVSIYYHFFQKETRILYLQGEWRWSELPILDIVRSKWKSLAWNAAEICVVIQHEIVKKCNKTQSCSWCNKTFFQERNSTNIKWYSMWKMWKTFERRDEISCAITYIECEKWMFLRRTFTEYVLEHAKVNKKLQWMRENIFLGKNFINLQNIVATYLPRSLTGALHCPFCKICTAFNLKVSVST